MAIISALNIGNTKYEIYATSASSAASLTNTAIKVASAGIADKATDSDKLGGIAASNVTGSAAHGQSAYNWVTGNTTGNSAKYAQSATSATKAAELTNTAIKVASATSANKANSAGKLSAAKTIAASSDVTWSVSFDGSQDVTGAATVNNVGSAISWSGVSAAVNAAIGDKIAGVYKVMGDSTWENLTANSAKVNGNVYNLTGEVPTTAKDRNDNKLYAGDNVVYVTAGTPGWDKLASTLDTSNFALKTGNYISNGLSAKYASDAGSATKALSAGTAATANYVDWSNVNDRPTDLSSFSGSAAYAKSATSASSAANAANAAKLGNTAAASIIGSAQSGMSAFNAITANSASWANQNAYAKVTVFTAAGGNAVTTNASSTQDGFGLSASDNISMSATSDANGHPIIAISAKDTNTTYSQGTGITISNTQISVTNYDAIVNSAKSGWSALSSISANSASWTANTKYSLSAWNGLSASYDSSKNTTDLKVVGVAATSANPGVTKASYVSANVAYIF